MPDEDPTAASPGSADTAPAAILRQALAWKDAAADVALATIVRAWPTAPMRAGSQMAVRGDGVCCGSLFGPPVDARVAQAALDVLDRGADPKLGVAVDDATASTAGLACGGALEIRLEAITEGDAGHAGPLRAALRAIEDRQGVVLCTRLSDGLRACLPANGAAAHAWAAEARDRARADDTGIASVDGDEVLFQVFNAPLRLFVVGAVRAARALLDAAKLVGFGVTLIDPRPGHMQAMPFPGARQVVDDAARALRDAHLDERCAVVFLSHAPEIDDPGLAEAIGSRAFYVGALGSRRTHAARLARLAERGHPPELTARIHGPAGLRIGAVGPAEIAASIVAEIVAVLRRGDAGLA